MNALEIYQIDAFAEKPFTGNPAAVIVMDEWIDTEMMQNIALENNLSETAFLVKKNQLFEIRYFTPNVEVELCGHASLASGFVLFNLLKYPKKEITFRTQNRGDLFVTQTENILTLDFPQDEIQKGNLPEGLLEAIKIKPLEVYQGRTDLLLVYETEEQIRSIHPNFELLKAVDARGIIITAPGQKVDFVSRFFAPREGINEDPVTGSAHTTLIPYWSKRFNKKTLLAQQLSKRGGTLYCELSEQRVKIGGKAIHYLTGSISI